MPENDPAFEASAETAADTERVPVKQDSTAPAAEAQAVREPSVRVMRCDYAT